jgi:pyridoxal 5'-phosphate synthase pdxS subunit
MRQVQSDMKKLTVMGQDELMAAAKEMGAPFALVQQVAKLGKLPVPNFAAGGIATPADASLMMQLGAETVFVGSGIFMSDDPAPRPKAIVDAVTYYKDSAKLVEISSGLQSAMKGLDMSEIPEGERLQERGW